MLCVARQKGIVVVGNFQPPQYLSGEPRRAFRERADDWVRLSCMCARKRFWMKDKKTIIWLVCCCLLALLVRIELVIHTHGVIDGDEALVGLQAEHILQGEWP